MKAITGKHTIQSEYPEILYDESRYQLGVPEALFFPESEEDIQSIVREATTKNKPITIIGAQTGITGGSIPIEGCYAISFSLMDSILRVSTNKNNDIILTCQPGITLEKIATFLSRSDHQTLPGKELLKEGSWFYPPDPTELTAQLGGTVATNASGARSFKYGATRNHTDSLSVVLASGERVSLTRTIRQTSKRAMELITEEGTVLSPPVLSIPIPQAKNAAGYHLSNEMDPIDLFIGSEGTLGIFSEIGIKLMPHPTILGGLSFFPTHTSAFTFADFLRTNASVAAIEYFDTSALHLIKESGSLLSTPIPSFPENAKSAIYWEYIETEEIPFESQEELWEENLNKSNSSFDKTWSGFDRREMLKLKAFRHAIPELINLQVASHKKNCATIRKISTDAAVPAHRFRDIFQQFTTIIAKANLEAIIFGHLGDYHLHFNIIPKSELELQSALNAYDQLMEIVIAANGTVSAEHGIGKLKKEYLNKMYGSEGIKVMKTIKSFFDPSYTLNPGNLF